MGGKTSAESRNKYNAKTYDRVALMLRKDADANKAAVQAAAEECGEKLNGYISKAIDQRMKRGNGYTVTVPREAADAKAEDGDGKNWLLAQIKNILE